MIIFHPIIFDYYFTTFTFLRLCSHFYNFHIFTSSVYLLPKKMNEDEMINMLKLTFPDELLHHIASYMTIFRIERRWKCSVLVELLGSPPVLKVFYPHINPNRFFIA